MGLSIPEVLLISGHRDVRMLLRYTHLRPTDLALKLNALSPNEAAQESKDTAHCEENDLISRTV
jgi:hypothetical protein